MPPKTLEERLSELEKKVAHLLGEEAESGSELEPKPEAEPDFAKLPGWLQKHAGAFKDDPYYEAAMEAGAEYRRSQPTGAEEWDRLEAERLKAEQKNVPA